MLQYPEMLLDIHPVRFPMKCLFHQLKRARSSDTNNERKHKKNQFQFELGLLSAFCPSLEVSKRLNIKKLVQVCMNKKRKKQRTFLWMTSSHNIHLIWTRQDAKEQMKVLDRKSWHKYWVFAFLLLFYSLMIHKSTSHFVCVTEREFNIVWMIRK